MCSMICSRRDLLIAAGLVAFPQLAIGELTKTAWQSEGPFYPDRMPEDRDNDLVLNGASTRRAGGQTLSLAGLLTNQQSQPLSGLAVEIWQTDMNGIYLHRRSYNHSMRDRHFQGYGRTITDNMGRFQFRTILPVPYPGRTPHIHMKILDASRGMLTTQLYLKGHPSNERDFLFKALNDLEREMNSLKLTRNSGGVHSKFSSSVRIVV